MSKRKRELFLAPGGLVKKRRNLGTNPYSDVKDIAVNVMMKPELFLNGFYGY